MIIVTNLPGELSMITMKSIPLIAELFTALIGSSGLNIVVPHQNLHVFHIMEPVILAIEQMISLNIQVSLSGNRACFGF